MEYLEPTDHTVTPIAQANATTKDELFCRARNALDAGEQSLKEAADALGLAKEDHSATQREMAEAVSKSASWVNKLLKWRASGYNDHSPFGPTTKTGRVEHAQQRTKTSKPRNAGETSRSDTDDAEGKREGRGAARPLTGRRISAAEAMGNLKQAIDQCWPHLDDEGKVKMTTYFLNKTGARVS